MSKYKLTTFLLLILGIFTMNIKDVNAAETEMYCRYAFSGASDTLLAGITNFVEIVLDPLGIHLGMQRGNFEYTTVDVVDNNGTPKGTITDSSKLYTSFDFDFNSDAFYTNGEFECPSVLYAKKDGSEIIFKDKAGYFDTFNYFFKRAYGPAERPVDPKNIDISDVTCMGILGSFATDLEGILKIIRIVAPILVIVLGTYDYITAILSKDAEKVKKSNGNLIKRLVLIAVLFFLPTILNILLGIINSNYTTCVY